DDIAIGQQRQVFVVVGRRDQVGQGIDAQRRGIEFLQLCDGALNDAVLAALAVVLGQIEQHDRHAGVDAMGGDLRAHDPGAAHRHAADEQGGGLAGLHDIVSSLVLMSCPIFRLSLICAENSNDRLNSKTSLSPWLDCPVSTLLAFPNWSRRASRVRWRQRTALPRRRRWTGSAAGWRRRSGAQRRANPVPWPCTV